MNHLPATTMKLRPLLAACCAALALPAWAAPTVIDFESLAHADDGVADAGWVVEEDGWRLTNAGMFPFASFGSRADGYAGSTALLNDNDGGTTTLTRADGGAFSLLSIALAELFAPSDLGVEVLFTGLRVDGREVSQRFTLDGQPGFERFAFGAGFDALSAVRWDNSAAYHQFDDIAVAAVPEPAGAALAGLALAALAAARRRRAR